MASSHNSCNPKLYCIRRNVVNIMSSSPYSRTRTIVYIYIFIIISVVCRHIIKISRTHYLSQYNYWKIIILSCQTLLSRFNVYAHSILCDNVWRQFIQKCCLPCSMAVNNFVWSGYRTWNAKVDYNDLASPPTFGIHPI